MSRIKAYAAPRSLAEAVALVADTPATILAGGTDLGLAPAEAFRPALVNITRVPELRGIDAAGRTVRLGALTTIAEILESALLRERVPVLVETADRFASGQIRNAATLGGNIMNASPAGDMIVPLLVLEAELELVRGAAGQVVSRRTPLRDFFTGPGATRARPGELLTAVHVPVPGEGFVAGFRKFGTRPALDISVVSVGLAGYRQDGGLEGVRVAFGAVAPMPLRGPRTEAAAEGVRLTAAALEAIAGEAAAEVRPISDVRASAWYRRRLVHTFMKRLLADVART